MKKSKLSVAVVIVLLITLFFEVNVFADEINSQFEIMAYGRFTFSVRSNSVGKNASGITFEAGETAVIKGTVSPIDADVEYGFVDSNGLFYGVKAQDGVMDYTFTIGTRGTYYFTVVNNSSVTVSVSGYINY